jgi:hypothetical protein
MLNEQSNNFFDGPYMIRDPCFHGQRHLCFLTYENADVFPSMPMPSERRRARVLDKRLGFWGAVIGNGDTDSPRTVLLEPRCQQSQQHRSNSFATVRGRHKEELNLTGTVIARGQVSGDVAHHGVLNRSDVSDAFR